MDNVLSNESLAKIAQQYVYYIKNEIKNELYLNSPLRNEFQVRLFDGGELPYFPNEYKTYFIGEEGQMVLENNSKRSLIPLFELASNISIPIKEIASSILETKNISKDALKLFLEKVKIMQAEEGIFRLLERYLENGKTIGFSIFEQVGAAVFCYKPE